MDESKGYGSLSRELKSITGHKVYTLVIILAIILLIGTAGFELLEGLGLQQAAYYTVTSAVGHSFEVIKHPGTVVLVSFLMIMEWACVWLVFEELVGIVSEGKVREVMEGAHIKKQINRMKNHHILAGAGRVGREIAKRLIEKKVPLVVIERDASVVKKLHTENYVVVHGDIMSEDTLKAAGIDRAKVLIAALGEDADNVFLTLTAKGLNPKIHIIARAEHDESIKKLKQAGAAEIIMPSVIGGRAMADASLD